MKPPVFKYRAAEHLEEVLQLLHEYGDEATLLAGGQSLVPTLNFRLAQPAVLIDLNRIDELADLRLSDGKLQLGAMVRQRTLERHPTIARHSPLLAACMPHVAHYQIRTRGTLGGSLSHADPSAELPAVVSALGGRMKLTSSASERWLPAGEYFRGMFQTDRRYNEILTEVELPKAPERSGWAFQEMARRHGDYALMGVAAVVTLDDFSQVQTVRLAYLSAGDGVVRGREAEAALRGNPLTESFIAEAALLAGETDIDPLPDLHASAEFRRHLARVLTGRALEQARDRALAGIDRESEA